jgi:hypothetical protein
MKTLALILLVTMMPWGQLVAQPHWNRTPAGRSGYWRRPVYSPYPAYRHQPGYRQPGGVSAGSAVAGAIAVGAVAGIIGYQLGRQNSLPQSVNCKTVTIDHDQKRVCRDAQGNWNVQ